MSKYTKEDSKLNIAVLTVSDTRSIDTDEGGNLIEQLLSERHVVITRKIVADNESEIREVLLTWGENPSVDVIITTGGTGMAKRDVTCETVRTLLDKEMSGFGEIFRYLSFTEDVGTRAMSSRALAGTYEGKLIFSLPGSLGAIDLAINRLILPELGHLFYEIKK